MSNTCPAALKYLPSSSWKTEQPSRRGAGTYTLFRFGEGVDHWVICLDDRYPHPVIREAFPRVQLNLM
jgi:hypothetical protein